MYVPRRTDRFEYVIDVINYVESQQCAGCAFREERDAMCTPVATSLIVERPCEELNELEDQTVVCTRFVPDVEHAPRPSSVIDQIPGQLTLF